MVKIAQRIASDKSRLLTLLKIEATGLPVPRHVPKNEIAEGQWSIALGRTLDAKRAQVPSVSVGIISATGRIWGKALQTDAKISPINYGGPMIDIEGRVQGILVPASPQGDDVTVMVLRRLVTPQPPSVPLLERLERAVSLEPR